MATLSHEVRKLRSKHGQREVPPTSRGIPRRVSVQGQQGVNATVVVTVVQGHVWLSISPSFTWEAIMEPAKVDELIHLLEFAKSEAGTVDATRNVHAPRGDKPVVRAITRGPDA